MQYFSKFLTLGAGIFLGVVVSFASAKVIEKSVGSDDFSLSAIDPEPISGLRQSETPEESIANSILIDAILTIVQSYYVDEFRAMDEKSLIKGALSYIKENHRIQVEQDDDLIEIQFGKISQSFDLSGNYSYQDLLDDAVAASKFLSKVPLEKLGINEFHNIGNPGAFTFLNALLRSLDPHSSLMDSEEYQELRQGTEGSFGGLGVVVGMQDNVLTVIKPLPKSPAAKAGIKGKDRIMFINEVSTFGTNLQNLVQHMRGDPGTEVKLSLLKNGDLAPREIFIKREVIQVDSLTESIKKAGKSKILTVQVDGFSSRTADEISESIEKNRRTNNIKGVVIDLRGNPGGLLDQAVKASDLFLKQGRIVSTEGRRPELEVAYKEKTDIDLPVVVLVDNNTASASEILAGALQDNNRAIVVGQPTFGKGSVQTVFELPANQALKLTIARYFTPSGNSIQNSGIMPDIWAQPVIPENHNRNLMGSSRFGSERFLANSLPNFRPTRSLPQFKLYYLEKENKTVDFEMDFALNLFRTTFEQLQKGEEVNLNRASYLLAANSMLIKQQMKDQNLRVRKYLNENHQVHWLALDPTRTYPELELEIKSGLELIASEGEVLTIKWKIKNPNNRDVKNIGLYLYSKNSQISAREQLIGNIKANSSVSGKVELDVLLKSNPTPYPIFLGLSSDATPIPGLSERVDLRVKDSEKPNIEYSLAIVDEAGGTADGLIEAGERAVLEVVVKNNSDIFAHDISASLSNFSGRQIKVEKDHFSLNRLPGKSKKVFHFPLVASKQLVTRSLHLGLTIDTREHLQPFTENHFVKVKLK